ncbi:MAG: Bacteriophage replication protein [Verrucomicrobiota bacterium]
MTFQEVMRAYAFAFTPTQLVVLLFIMDRTVGWGKRWEKITQRQFLNGIPSFEEDAVPYAGKLKMTLNTLKNALRRLITVGLVLERKLEGGSTAYSLSENCFSYLPDEKKPKIKKAKTSEPK